MNETRSSDTTDINDSLASTQGGTIKNEREEVDAKLLGVNLPATKQTRS